MTGGAKFDAPAGAALWPELRIAEWAETYATLHMITQIVGKTRLALAPMQNHWWQVTLYAGARGLTTGAMPYRGRTISIELDFIDHAVVIRTSEGGLRTVALVQRPVAEFYDEYLAVLRSLDLTVPIFARPVEVEVSVPFATDTVHASYDRDAVRKWWGAMLQADRVFRRFRGDFEGKASPVHFFWGSFDLAATRFSGRGAPLHPGGAPNCPDYVMQEAYSRECSSAGFWPGGGTQEAAFYAYAYPEPPGFGGYSVAPEAAYYDPSLREFILPYDAVRNAESPDGMLLDFLQSTYAAEAELAKWDRGMLERKSRQQESV
jgi:uncharacterized protein DUF5996